MALLDKQSLPSGLLTTIEEAVWPAIKEKLNPIAWQWFENNKDKKITSIFGFYPIYWGSFGLVKLAIIDIFGSDTRNAQT
jgi:hypothetical protein